MNPTVSDCWVPLLEPNAQTADGSTKLTTLAPGRENWYSEIATTLTGDLRSNAFQFNGPAGHAGPAALHDKLENKIQCLSSTGEAEQTNLILLKQT